MTKIICRHMQAVFADSEHTDQHVHQRNLIRAFTGSLRKLDTPDWFSSIFTMDTTIVTSCLLSNTSFPSWEHLSFSCRADHFSEGMQNDFDNYLP